MKLLIVEDDLLLGAGLRSALEHAGFVVTWVRDGGSALAALHAEDFVVMVLDMGLPVFGGLEVLRRLRSEGKMLPVLILTARDATRDKVAGLDAGADDYLVKTADVEELVARLRALVRRTGRADATLKLGELTLNLDTRTVVQQGESISVSRREFDVLRALMESAGRVLTRTQLEESLYGWNGGVESNALEVHVHNLRVKLGPTLALKTVRGVGYMLARPTA